MLRARSALSAREENSLCSQTDNMALDKENTVRLLLRAQTVGGHCPDVFALTEPCPRAAPVFPVVCGDLIELCSLVFSASQWEHLPHPGVENRAKNLL